MAISKKKIVGGTGITADGDVTFGDVTGQLAIGENIIQIINKDDSKAGLYTNGIRQLPPHMPTPGEENFDVFMSHSHLDAELVEKLAEMLEDHAKLRVWLDKWILVPGEHWRQAMACGLGHAKSCTVCIGKETPKGWFQEEIGRALNRQTKDTSFRVIPVLLPNAQAINVDEFLELRTWVDFRNGLDDSKEFHRLISGIRGKAPGRGQQEEVASESSYIQERQILIQIQQWRQENLLDDDTAREGQRMLLKKIIRGGRPNG